MTATAPERVSIADGWLWLLRLGCPALGFGLAFGIRPLVDWLSDLLGGMPGWVQFIAERYVQRAEVDAVFIDPNDLVVLAADGRQLYRGKATDVATRALADVFERNGYPWRGTSDPHEQDYSAWVDRHPDRGGEQQYRRQ